MPESNDELMEKYKKMEQIVADWIAPATLKEISYQRSEINGTLRTTVPTIDAHLYTPYGVLDNGFIRIIDYMGDDAAIVQAARVSYGKGTKSFREDAGLINYLMSNDHTSPFEMCEIKFHIKAPIFVVRQWFRHRTANQNEYSARYSQLPDDFYTPRKEDIRYQDAENKQASGDQLENTDASYSFYQMNHSQIESFKYYEELLERGVSREQARVVIPVGAYTQFYWKIDLHNLLRFLKLRLDEHAQYEIRQYAKNMYSMAKLWVPETMKAFDNHVLHAIRLSEEEKHIVHDWLMGMQRNDVSPRLLKSISRKLQLEYDK